MNRPSETLRRIVQTRAGGRVERCHGLPHHGSYSNAAHQWGVAMLMYHVFPQDFQFLVGYCLQHDVPEAWVGDIPATTKRYAPGVGTATERLENMIASDLGLLLESDLCEDDYSKLKACDHLELYMWCLEEVNSGNLSMYEVILQLEQFFRQRPLPEAASRLFEEIRSDKTLLIARRCGVIEELCHAQATHSPGSPEDGGHHATQEDAA